MKEQLQKIKGMIIKEDEKDSKKKLENMVAFIVILIVTVIIINVIWSGDSKEEKTISNSNRQLAQVNNTQNTNNEGQNQLKYELENILSKINGVGKVEVLVTYAESSQIVAMYNENTKETSTEETDESGGTRVIKESDTQKDVIYEEEDGMKKPITQKTIMPQIEGAIITAEGASNATVKTNIIQAVEAATGLATHKIQVFEMIVK